MTDERDPFLTPAQVRRLSGFAVRGKQAAALRRMGVPFHVNGRGDVIVARAHVEGREEAPPKAPAAWVPAVILGRKA